MKRYQQNYFSCIFVVKDAKSCLVFFLIINVNFIFIFIFESFDHMQFEINLYFLKERFFFVFVERNQFI